MAEILVHLNIETPEGDDRDANALADAILAALGAEPSLGGLVVRGFPLEGLLVVCPLAEEV